MAEAGPALDELIRRTATTAKALVGANGLVVYRVAADGQFGDLLFADEDQRRCAAYRSGHYRDDPLAPAACLKQPARVLCLHERLAADGAAERRYFSEFMRPYGLVDAAEMFIGGTDNRPLLGFSLLRNIARPWYSPAELGALADFQGLAEQLFGYLAPIAADNARQRLGRRFPALTPRELDVAIGIADGLANKLIARREGLALSTVKTHLQSVFRKCGVVNRSELVRLAC